MAEAVRFMFGKIINSGKKVSAALNRKDDDKKGCIRDQARCQKKGPILFRVRVLCRTEYLLDLGRSDLGRQELLFDKDGNPW